MSASAHNAVDRSALEKLIGQSGVEVTAADVEAVARSLERIESAAATLLRSLPFDETNERFYRLLENDPAEGADR
jgi:hypothetical protein